MAFKRKPKKVAEEALPITEDTPIAKNIRIIEEAPKVEETSTSPYTIEVKKGAYYVSKDGREIFETDKLELAEKFIKERP